jgi:putative transposase
MNNSTPNLEKVIQVDEARIQEHLGKIVRGTVEETLNAMLDAEAEQLCQAARYERSDDRRGYRAGHYERTLHTTAGEVKLKVPKLKRVTYETAIIERYRRRESSVEEALVEMYLAGVSVRRVEDITEALWGTRVSVGTVSRLNQQVYERIEAWRNEQLTEEFPYVYLDGIVLKRSWAGEVRNISVLVAIGVDQSGYRRVLGVMEGAKEDKSGWSGFLAHLKARGLKQVQLFISDACGGLVESLGEHYPQSRWQRCTVHFYRNIFSIVPATKVREVASMLKAIHAAEDRNAAIEKAEQVAVKLTHMKLEKAAARVRESIAETLSYYSFPETHWRRIRTNNPLERMMREIRRRTRVVGAFPDGEAALMLTAARLRYMAATAWGTKRYLCMETLYKHLNVEAA